ncbi:DUF2771 domain-containing protein [Antrihabitans spumae]|uniref:DUF2771 domain-containing protein n=1 Tax=Antrihabitans spumae TaxID=3373370 RepID=A0ABW7JMC0_9NOCA
MRLQPKTVKILALLGTGVLVVAVAFFAVLFVLVKDSDPRLPAVTAYAYGEAITVEPTRYCELDLTECSEEGSIAKLQVPVGYPLQLSLPKELSDAPWRLYATYDGPNGLEIVEQGYRPGQATAVSVRSKTTPEAKLLGVEIRLPSSVVDENGDPFQRAVWLIETA